MLKNRANYYIYLYFPYVLTNVVSHMMQEGFTRVADCSICKYDGILEHHLWADYRSCSKDGYYPRGKLLELLS